MKNIVISGPLLSNSGYGVHCRQVFTYLLENAKDDEKLHCHVTEWGNSSWHLSNEFTSGLFDKIIDRHISENSLYNMQYEKCYSVGFPNEWVLIGKKNIGITAGIETSIAPNSWLENIKRANSVIVPSFFAKNTIVKTFSNCHDILNKIKVVPEYFYEEFLEDSCVKIDLLDKITTTNNLLIIGQLTSLNSENDRKNTLNAIEATTRILSTIEDSSLILKINSGNNTQKDFKNIKEILKPVLDNIRKELGNSVPKVYIIHGNLSPKELKTLYTTKTSALLCLSRGEGFGLTLLEAAACGCPIIATNYSAYTEFLGDNFIKVDYNLEEIPASRINDVFVKGSLWANYKARSLHLAVLNFFNNKDKYSIIAKKLKLNIVSNFNKNSIFKIYKKCLEWATFTSI